MDSDGNAATITSKQLEIGVLYGVLYVSCTDNETRKTTVFVPKSDFPVVFQTKNRVVSFGAQATHGSHSALEIITGKVQQQSLTILRDRDDPNTGSSKNLSLA